ncbi:hypothetical protein MRBL20_002290 [Peribacillus frigoritolerans]
MGTIVTTANTHDSHILKLLVELGLRKLENEKLLPQMQLIKHQRLQATYLTK